MTEIVIGPIYRHYKTGGHYRILVECKHETDLQPMVVYQDISDETKIWARAKDSFCETVTFEGVEQPRFRLLDDAG